MEQDTPIGLALSQATRHTTRAFDAALVAAGGTLPMWLILQALVVAGPLLQSDLAARVGVQGPTLTHHLNAFEGLGLVLRTRTASDRRNHQVTLLPAGQHTYDRLRVSAQAYDAALRGALSQAEAVALRAMLMRLADVASAFPAQSRPAAPQPRTKHRTKPRTKPRPLGHAPHG